VVRRHRWRGLAVAALASLVAACAAATAPPSRLPEAVSSEVAAATRLPPPPSAPASTGSPGDGGDLVGRIEIGSIDPALTHPIEAFASDGEAVVYSSAIASDAGPDGAPDLWRVVVPHGEPELLWRNPERNHAIVVIVGDLGSYSFVEMPLSGERGWKLWLLPRGADEAIQLDAQPDDAEVSSYVPSMAIYEDTVVWTAFDRGTSGPVSQLRIAQAPEWEPRTIREVAAADAELWFPSLLGSSLAYVEVTYGEDRSHDERHVYLTSTAPGAERQRLDRSGLATNPVVTEHGVLWKETEEGFAMMNWGKIVRFDPEDGTVRRLSTRPQQWVNYPSAGYRYAAWWGADSFQLGVYDLVRDEPQLLARHSIASQISELRPHIAGDLLVWVQVVLDGGDERSELRYAFLPGPRDP
jgi:hypothetical protein